MDSHPTRPDLVGQGRGVEARLLPCLTEEPKPVKAFVPTWDLRRRAERVGVELPVQIEGHAGTTKGRTVDLSAVGARVATDERLTPGDMVSVKLTPKDSQGPMRIRAVVWEVDARGALTGPVPPLRMNDGSVNRHA